MLHTDPTERRTLSQLKQLALQAAAAFTVLSVCWPYFGLKNEPLPWPDTAIAIGLTALLLSVALRQPWWWRLIHALFAPALWCASTLAIAPEWFLIGFMALLLFYRGAPHGQIPLYLSNAETARALSDATQGHNPMSFLDLGAGIGSIVRPLARLRPESQISGIENSPGPWLLGYMSTRNRSNCTWLWGNFWHTSLSKYDVVYAFLSPAPMSALWIKAQREMKPNSLFISNSFPVPGVEPRQIIEVGDAAQTRLYCYAL